MLKEVENYTIASLKRWRLPRKLKNIGLVIDGEYIYVHSSKENEKINGHYPRVAFMETYYKIRILNKDEPCLKPFHDELEKICMDLS